MITVVSFGSFNMFPVLSL